MATSYPLRPPAPPAPAPAPVPVQHIVEDDEDDDMYENVSSTNVQQYKKQRRQKSSSDDEESASSGAEGAGVDSSNGSDNGTSNSATVAEVWTQIPSAPTTAKSAGPASALTVKRKRGRPTKAEAEARKAAIARGELPPPKPPTYTPVATPVYTVGPDGVHRRRRGRPSKAEIAARKAAEATASGNPIPK